MVILLSVGNFGFFVNVPLTRPPLCFHVAVRNLPYDITEDEVRNFFLPAGTPSRIACDSMRPMDAYHVP